MFFKRFNVMHVVDIEWGVHIVVFKFCKVKTVAS